jgi:hypothetical protein
MLPPGSTEVNPKVLGFLIKMAAFEPEGLRRVGDVVVVPLELGQ